MNEDLERVWFPSGRSRLCVIYHDSESGLAYIKFSGERLVVQYGGKSSELPHYSVRGFLEHEEEEQ